MTDNASLIPPISAPVQRSDATGNESPLFAGGPPEALGLWLGLRRRGEAHLARRAMIAVAIAWAPLALLTAARGDFLRRSPARKARPGKVA
jgi:hypothetical protein